MRRRYTLLPLLGLLLLAPSFVSASDLLLEAAYAAILRGDYDSGRTTINDLLTKDTELQDARQALTWLDSYHEVVASRKDLKAKTFDWNVTEAKKAKEENDLRLALAFAAQAMPYAADETEYAQQPWIAELTKEAKLAAGKYERKGKWDLALGYYSFLSRIHEDDETIKELRKHAVRHARVEYAYEDEEALERRLKDVDKRLLENAIQMVSRLYYEEPDFKQMANGAIENLITLAGASKPQEFLDGLANPALRDHFVQKLEEISSDIKNRERFSQRDLERVFNTVAFLNRGSVELPEALLVVEFVEGFISELDDFTGMVWPVDAREFDKMMMGGFEGVGIQLGVDEISKRLKVVTPLENSPALEAGIEPEDLIIAVDGESTKGWTTDDAVQNIMGPGGSEVVLTIFRPETGQRLDFKLVRRKIELHTVQGVERIPGKTDNKWNYMLDEDTGVAFIRLSNFLPKSEDELERALREARDQGMRGLVLDVRHNPGGLLDVAIDVVSDFLADGEVVSTRGRVEREHRERVGGRARYRDVPLVILVNEGSASASEILAGALQDHNRAIVLGDRTFGKGSVQHVRGLGNDARLKLTTALYYLPSGRTPHKAPDADVWGVDPDWHLRLTPKEFRRVLERQRDVSIIRNGAAEQPEALSEEDREKAVAELKDDTAEDDEDEPFLTEEQIERLDGDPFEAPDTDPQLETALLLIRVKLAADVPWPRDLAAAFDTDRRP